MKNILDDLFYGRFCPSELDLSVNWKYKHAVDLLVKKETILISNLSESNKQLLENFSDAQRSLNEVTALEYFKIGFKLAAKLYLVISDETGLLDKLP